ncbi:hypothetical protein FACS1894204_09210 [Synergistales bacterium]|nr:hypothetical protein FACS1894204_09210 [Synergistales bacterium]
MKIPVYERQEQIAPLPGVRVNAHGGEAAYGGDVARGLGNFAQAGLRLAADLDDAKTLEAFNNFKKEVSVYHNDPNKGVLNRLGKETEGLYASADEWMSAKADEYLKKMPNSRVARAFQKMAGGVITSQGEHNSRYEAKQIQAYRSAEADATIEGALGDAAENFADEAAVAQAKEVATLALEVKTRGFGDEARKLALADLDDRIGAARLGRMIEADPLSAEAWFNENKGSFSAPTRAKAETVLKQKTELFKTQMRVDELIKAFPPQREREALQYIRSRFSGEEEERIASAYKMRVNEAEVRRGNAEAGIRQVQNNNFGVLLREYYENMNVPPPDMLGDMYAAGQISQSQYTRAMGMADTFASFDRAEKFIAPRVANWGEMSRDVQEQIILQRMGTSPQRRRDALAELEAGFRTGDILKEDIPAWVGRITKSDANRMKQLAVRLTTEDKEDVKLYRDTAIDEALDILGSKYKDKVSVRRDVSLLYNKYLKSMSPDEARQKAVLDAIANTGVGIEKENGWLWKETVRTSTGKRLDEVKSGWTATEEDAEKAEDNERIVKAIIAGLGEK